jgi:predicted nucleotidyltransferase
MRLERGSHSLSKRPEVLHEEKTIIYDDEHWSLLTTLRERAADTVLKLEKIGIRSFVYGSLARGDISKTSDIDIIILEISPSYKIEVALGSGTMRELVQATPSSVLKGHLHLDNETVVSFPIFKMMSREREFYQWGGMISSDEISRNVRVPGVDKRLVMIDPTDSGHIEYGVVGYESSVAKKIGVSVSIANERVRVLKRRDEVGRTGVYRTYHLHDDETFETAAKKLADSDPALRRTIRRRD